MGISHVGPLASSTAVCRGPFPYVRYLPNHVGQNPSFQKVQLAVPEIAFNQPPIIDIINRRVMTNRRRLGLQGQSGQIDYRH